MIILENYVDGPEMPLGLGMALAQNMDAMNYFASLSREQQTAIIQHTHSISSKSEMRAFVDSLVNNNSFY